MAAPEKSVRPRHTPRTRGRKGYCTRPNHPAERPKELTMKLFSARTAVLGVLTAALALAPAGAEEPKKSDPPAPVKEKIMVWVEKFFASYDCSLETELTVNGKSVGKF